MLKKMISETEELDMWQLTKKVYTCSTYNYQHFSDPVKILNYKVNHMLRGLHLRIGSFSRGGDMEKKYNNGLCVPLAFGS